MTNIIEVFNEVADFNILKESKKRFKIKDMQTNDVFTVNKKYWLEKIKFYYQDEYAEILSIWFDREANAYRIIGIAKCNQDLQFIGKNKHIAYRGSL